MERSVKETKEIKKGKRKIREKVWNLKTFRFCSYVITSLKRGREKVRKRRYGKKEERENKGNERSLEFKELKVLFVYNYQSKNGGLRRR